MDINDLGEFGFIDRITGPFRLHHPESLKGPGDDAAVIDAGSKLLLVSTELYLEGIHFDLTYTPLKHLGYKIVVGGISDLLAMNGIPRQITVSIGLSGRFTVEDAEELYQGIETACKVYDLDLVGGDTSPSLTGLTLGITAIGETEKERIVYRSGAGMNDLICVSGTLGSALMGLKLLEREKRVLQDNRVVQPKFDGFESLLEKQLKPEARIDLIEEMRREGVVPTSMIDLSDGLASEVLHICKSSRCGARIYLDKIPIAREVFTLAEEMNFDPVVAALNGGEDYELLFTVPLKEREKLKNLPGIDVIGHITAPSTGAALTTPDGQEIILQAPGWRFNDEANDV